MKKINFITSIAGCMMGLMALCTSCSQDVEDVTTPDVPKEEVIGGMYSVKMNFNVSKTDFDSQGATRYANNAWEDNDVVFIRFISTDSTIVLGNAIYSATNEDWTVNYEKPLLKDSITGCQVYYIEGTKATDEVLRASSISIPDSVGSDIDTTATYNYPSHGTLTVTASLAPITSRIRFCGEEGDSIVITGISYYNIFEKASANFNISTGPIIAKTTNVINSRYSTRYIYGFFANNESKSITIKNNDINYLLSECGENILRNGRSGWMNIPSEFNHNGWEKQAMVNFDPWTSTNTSSGSYKTYTLETQVGSILTFDYNVSSEQNYDKFNVLIDGTVIFSASGTSQGTSYTTYSYTFAVGGSHTLRFEYSKDASGVAGLDRVSVKNITLSY